MKLKIKLDFEYSIIKEVNESKDMSIEFDINDFLRWLDDDANHIINEDYLKQNILGYLTNIEELDYDVIFSNIRKSIPEGYEIFDDDVCYDAECCNIENYDELYAKLKFLIKPIPQITATCCDREIGNYCSNCGKKLK